MKLLLAFMFFVFPFVVVISQNIGHVDCGVVINKDDYHPQYHSYSQYSSKSALNKALSSKGNIVGNIIDAWTDKPIEGLRIYNNNNLVSVTDSKGNYSVYADGVVQIKIMDPLDRYHDYIRYVNFSSADTLSIEMIPSEVDMGLMRMLYFNRGDYPILKVWEEFPIKVFINDEECYQTRGNYELAEAVRDGIETIEEFTGMDVYVEVDSELEVDKEYQTGINISYRETGGACGLMGTYYDDNGVPRSGVLTMHCGGETTAIHELGHSFGFGHLGSYGFVMDYGTQDGARNYWNPFPDYRLELNVLKTIINLPNGTDLSCYSQSESSFTTPNTGVNWDVDELVQWSNGAIIGNFPDYTLKSSIIISTNDKISIPSGVRILIEPTCKFSNTASMNSFFEVNGTLNFNGTKENFITVYSNPDFKWLWDLVYYRKEGEVNISFSKFFNSRQLIFNNNSSSQKLFITNSLFTNFRFHPVSFVQGALHIPKIYNCTFDGADMFETDPEYQAILFFWGSVSDFYDVRNNIFINAPTGVYQKQILDVTNLRGYNLFYNIDTPYNKYSLATGDLKTNPSFVKGSDYILDSNSPAIDSGDPEFPNDQDGSISDIGYINYSENLLLLDRDQIFFSPVINQTVIDTIFIQNSSGDNYVFNGFTGKIDPFEFLGTTGSTNPNEKLGVIIAYKGTDYDYYNVNAILSTSVYNLLLKLEGASKGINGPTDLSTHIGNYEFTIDDSPIFIPNYKTVELNEKLVLGDGVVFQFGESTTLKLNNGFEAIGSQSNNVIIEPSTKNESSWQTNDLYVEGGDVVLKNVKMKRTYLKSGRHLNIDSCLFISSPISNSMQSFTEPVVNISHSVFDDSRFNMNIAHAVFDHCLFTGQRTYFMCYYEYLNTSRVPTINVSNSIFWNARYDSVEIGAGNNTPPVTDYSYNIMDLSDTNSNNIYIDPLISSDYKLTSVSAALDSGDPNFPLDPDGTRTDLGPYYFNQSVEQIKEAEILLIKPKNKTFISKDSVFFDWLINGQDDYSGNSYLVIDTNITLNSDSILVNNSTSYLFDTLVEDIKYYWMVTFTNTSGEIINSDVNTFITVNPDQPNSFDLLYPDIGDTVRSNLVNFIWEESTDPDPGQFSLYSLFIETIDTQFNYVTPDTTLELDFNNLIDGSSILSFSWWVRAISYGDTIYSNNTNNCIYDVITGNINNEQGIPQTYELSQSYPNPFNPSTTIRFGLPRESKVSLELYNVLGEKIETLLNQNLKAGYHSIIYDASKLSSGIYLYRIITDDFKETKKMILVK